MKEYSIDMGKFKQCGANSQTICFLPMIHLWQATKARRSHRISGFCQTKFQFCDTESFIFIFIYIFIYIYLYLYFSHGVLQERWKALNEINAGSCEELTYEEVRYMIYILSHMRRWDIWYIYYHVGGGGEMYDIYIIT